MLVFCYRHRLSFAPMVVVELTGRANELGSVLTQSITD
jgi:hypothetical protein